MLDQRHIVAIHAKDTKAVLAITGGGTDAIGNLLRFGGGSNTLLEAVVPYHQTAFDEFVGGKPDRYCSPEAARDLAMAAFLRAYKLTERELGLVGIGATCSLAKGGPERAGRVHHAFIALQTPTQTKTRSVKFPQGEFSREQEEDFVAGFILDLLSEEAGVTGFPRYWPLNTGKFDETVAFADRHIFNLIRGYTQLVTTPLTFAGNGRPRVVFPGSFNPIHADHIRMAKVATEITGSPVAFEISVHNVEKPPLNYQSIQDRTQSILAEHQKDPSFAQAICLTNAPLFEQKAVIFPNSTFVVGFDTIERIGNIKYYKNDDTLLFEAIDRLQSLGTKFLVFHRKRNGVVSTVEDMLNKVPGNLRNLTQLVPLEKYTPSGLSSTDIRQEKQSHE